MISFSFALYLLSFNIQEANPSPDTSPRLALATTKLWATLSQRYGISRLRSTNPSFLGKLPWRDSLTRSNSSNTIIESILGKNDWWSPKRNSLLASSKPSMTDGQFQTRSCAQKIKAFMLDVHHLSAELRKWLKRCYPKESHREIDGRILNRYSSIYHWLSVRGSPLSSLASCELQEISQMVAWVMQHPDSDGDSGTHKYGPKTLI